MNKFHCPIRYSYFTLQHCLNFNAFFFILLQLFVSCRFFQNKEKCLVEINDAERAQLRSKALESMLGTSGKYFPILDS